MDGKLQQDYDSRLAEELQRMREQNDSMIRITREETEEMFAQKVCGTFMMAKAAMIQRG